jgi:hypothetical protein
MVLKRARAMTLLDELGWNELHAGEKRLVLQDFGFFCADIGIPDVMKERIYKGSSYYCLTRSLPFPTPAVLTGQSTDGIVNESRGLQADIEAFAEFEGTLTFARRVVATSKRFSDEILGWDLGSALHIYVHENLHNVLDLPLPMEEAVGTLLAYHVARRYAARRGGEGVPHLDKLIQQASLLGRLHNEVSEALIDASFWEPMTAFEGMASTLNHLFRSGYVPGSFDARRFLEHGSLFVNEGYLVHYNKYYLAMPLAEGLLAAHPLEDVVPILQGAPSTIRECAEYFAYSADVQVPRLYSFLPQGEKERLKIAVAPAPACLRNRAVSMRNVT